MILDEKESEFIKDLLILIKVQDYIIFDTGCLDIESDDEDTMKQLKELENQKLMYVQLANKFGIEVDIEKLAEL